jgi:hypothetical protein
MEIQSSRFKFVSAALVLALGITPEMFAQQGSGQSAPSQEQQQSQQAPSSGTQPAATGPQQGPGEGSTINPSQPPLQPVTTYPGASETQQDQPASSASTDQANPPSAPQPKQQPTQPVGAANAERVPTAGGAAAKPAGAAIAPAKQHQTRSLLIKIGAIAAAGAAIGTVYGLSRSSPSVPPNSGTGIRK